MKICQILSYIFVIGRCIGIVVDDIELIVGANLMEAILQKNRVWYKLLFSFLGNVNAVFLWPDT